MDPRATQLLDFWFDGWTDDTPMGPNDPCMARWWGGGAALDAEISGRFGGWLDEISGPAGDAWEASPRGALARVILLDQVSRVHHRGTGRAFENDPLARQIVHRVLDAGADAQLALIERQFLLMPLMHAEDTANHDRAVAEFQRLADDAAAAGSVRAASYLGTVDFERRHKAIVDRFGHYPHRNERVGRTSTAEEIAFLAEPGSSFG